MRTHGSNAQMLQGKTLAWRDILPQRKTKGKSRDASKPPLPAHPSCRGMTHTVDLLYDRYVSHLFLALRKGTATNIKLGLSSPFSSSDPVEIWRATRHDKPDSLKCVALARVVEHTKQVWPESEPLERSIKTIVEKYDAFVVDLTSHKTICDELSYAIRGAEEKAQLLGHGKRPYSNNNKSFYISNFPSKVALIDTLKGHLELEQKKLPVMRRAKLSKLVFNLSAISKAYAQTDSKLEAIAHVEEDLRTRLDLACGRFTCQPSDTAADVSLLRATWARAFVPSDGGLAPPCLAHGVITEDERFIRLYTI